MSYLQRFVSLGYRTGTLNQSFSVTNIKYFRHPAVQAHLSLFPIYSHIHIKMCPHSFSSFCGEDKWIKRFKTINMFWFSHILVSIQPPQYQVFRADSLKDKAFFQWGRGGCDLKSLSCQYSALCAILKCTVEKYIKFTLLKEIILSYQKIDVTCESVKQNKLSWAWWDFLSLYRHPKWIQKFYHSFHMLHARVPIRWGEDWGQAGCGLSSVSCYQKSS